MFTRIASLLVLLSLHSNRHCCHVLGNNADFERSKRYLVYPTPGTYAPTKVQLILGLGLPMEVDVSMIIGYVMKFNYVLPSNASYFTDPYVRYDRSITWDVEANESEVSAVNTEVGISRWEIYGILESALETSRSGKGCLLRLICEAAEVPVSWDYGLCAEFIHLLLTPSTTTDPFRTSFDQEYRTAENLGRQYPGFCGSFFPECTQSLLDFFTEEEPRRLIGTEPSGYRKWP